MNNNKCNNQTAVDDFEQPAHLYKSNQLERSQTSTECEIIQRIVSQDASINLTPLVSFFKNLEFMKMLDRLHIHSKGHVNYLIFKCLD